jgi:hypothetical protein
MQSRINKLNNMVCFSNGEQGDSVCAAAAKAGYSFIPTLTILYLLPKRVPKLGSAKGVKRPTDVWVV